MPFRPFHRTVAGCLPLFALAAQAASFDATADFDITGGGGVWQYGYDSAETTGYDFKAFDLFSVGAGGYGWTDSQYNTAGTPAIWTNVSGALSYGVPDGWMSLHPGPSTQSVHSDAAILRFTAPATGGYTVRATTLVGDWGQTESWLVVNGDIDSPWLYRGVDIADLTTTGHLVLNAGDTLDLVIGSRDGFVGDNSPVHLTITSSVPEPGPATLLAAGLAALAWRQRQARA